MLNLQDLRDQRAHKALCVKELFDKADTADPPRPLTADECTVHDQLVKDIGQLDERIAGILAHQRRVEEKNKLFERLDKSSGPSFVQGSPDVAAEPAKPRADFTVPATACVTSNLKAFRPHDGETNVECKRRAYRAGQWLRAMVFRDQTAAGWCEVHGVGDIRAAMSGGSNPDGGFLVPEEFSQAIIDLREQYGWARQNFRIWPMGRDTLDIPRRAGGVTIGPIGENPAAAITQSNPTFSMVKLVAKKAGGLTLLSSEISADSVISLADWVAQEFAYGFSLFEDQCAYLGDGTSTYLGITGLKTLFSTTGPLGALKGQVSAASPHDTMAEIDQTDIANLMAALPQYAKINAKFHCSAVFDEMVFGRLMAIAGGNTVQTLQGLRGRSYMGYPIVISQVMETATTTINGTPYCFFGDTTKSSALGDRLQVRVFPSEHRYMDTDQVAIRGTARFDIVHNDVGDTTTAGPLVALLGKT